MLTYSCVCGKWLCSACPVSASLEIRRPKVTVMGLVESWSSCFKGLALMTLLKVVFVLIASSFFKSKIFFFFFVSVVFFFHSCLSSFLWIALVLSAHRTNRDWASDTLGLNYYLPSAWVNYLAFLNFSFFVKCNIYLMRLWTLNKMWGQDLTFGT